MVTSLSSKREIFLSCIKGLRKLSGTWPDPVTNVAKPSCRCDFRYGEPPLHTVYRYVYTCLSNFSLIHQHSWTILLFNDAHHRSYKIPLDTKLVAFEPSPFTILPLPLPAPIKGSERRLDYDFIMFISMTWNMHRRLSATRGIWLLCDLEESMTPDFEKEEDCCRSGYLFSANVWEILGTEH